MPIALLAYHYGPGQQALARDAAAELIARAVACEAKEDWKQAMEAYGGALAKIPESDREARWQVRLAQAKARMYTGELPEAIADLESLLEEMGKAKAPEARQADVRANLAKAGYYAAWLMRLEGAPREEWMVQAENARQHFRLLSENALAGEAAQAKGHQENLEATIRLARMDLSELQAMPLPKFCNGCKNVSQKCRNQCEGKSKGQKPKEEKKEDARRAGAGERPPGGS